MNMLSITQSSAEYIDSAYIYLDATAEIITKTGATTNPQLFEDAEILRTYQKDLPLRTLTIPRIQENRYPYLLTFLHPIRLNLSRTNVGMVVLNVDVEKLGDYIDRGRYRNTEDAPMLLIFDKDMQTMVYSDEYRLLRGENDMQELQTLVLAQGDTFTTTGDLWGKGYVISGMISSDDNLRYLYLSTTQAFDDQCRDADQRLLLSVAVICLICLMLASLLAAWVYRPIRKTVKLLSDMSMLTEWDRKEHMDEIEAIQRSIVQAKKQRDDMDEEIQERMVSLHNAQICALQTQINPHFLFNTLESIGNASALLMGGENQVTDMIYTLSKMMRLSLSNENYLVPLSEELEHVRQYVALIDFRFRGRVTLHLEIPDEMTSTRIVKLTLQPLIENAIQHGLAHVRSGGEIWIRGEKIDEAYYLYVSDNGKGVDDAELERLTKQLKDSAITGNGHTINHRLRIAMPLTITGQDVYEIPYGWLERKEYGLTRFREGSENWAGSINDYPAMNWAGVQAEQCGVFLFNQGTPSHYITSNQNGGRTIFVTPLRSPNNATYLHDPAAYSMTDWDGMRDAGTHEFSYMLESFAGNKTQKHAVLAGAGFAATPLVTEGEFQPLELPVLTGDSARISSIKCAEDDDALIVRMVEINGEKTQISMRVPDWAASVELTDLNEHTTDGLEIVNGMIQLQFHPFEIKTVKLKIKR